MKLLRILALALGAVLPQLAAAQAPALATFPVGTATVTASALAANLSTIWELAWGPDNFIWMTERGGRISRVNPATGQVLPLLTIPDVTENGESGLLGLAVVGPPTAPSATYWVFVVYNYTDQGVLKEKLVRYPYANGTLGSPLVLLGNLVAATNHSGSRLLVLPDQTLLMTTGDALVASEAQNRTSLNGKILRLNLDGTIPASNPTAGSLVYTLGHRNPQGLVRLPNGAIYSSEHGPNNDDEINKIEAGRNYGWPNVEGSCDLPAEATFCTANNVREPLTTWTPTIAPAGLAYYDHPAIPGWRGSLLLAVLKGNSLTQLPLDAAGLTIASRTNYLTGFGRLRAICVSPEGRVYVGTSNRDGRGTPAATDDRILVLENRAYVATATRTAADLAFNLFPNPARRQATVQLPVAGCRLRVSDLLGRTVLSVPPSPSPTVVLDLAALRPGTYLVQADGPAGRGNRRLVVE